MCECCEAHGTGKQNVIPNLYHRWKYSSCDKAIYLARDDKTDVSYLVFNSESDSGYSLDDDSYECIKLEIHNCPICGRDLDKDVPEGLIAAKKAEQERLRREAEERKEAEKKERRYQAYLQLKEEFEGK